MNAPCAVHLRPARAADATALARLSRDLIEAGLPWRYTPRRIGALLADADHLSVVAADPQRRADAGAVQGFALMQFGDADAHLVLLCVQPAQRRNGVGRCLLQWQLASARVAGMAAVRLEVRADNADAQAFYRACGFAPTLLLPDYYAGGIAAQRMQLALRAAASNHGPTDPHERG